jgi:hypothetical protein
MMHRQVKVTCRCLSQFRQREPFVRKGEKEFDRKQEKADSLALPGNKGILSSALPSLGKTGNWLLKKVNWWDNEGMLL